VRQSRRKAFPVLPEEPDRYVGGELDLFAQASNWKAYLRQQIAPFLGDQVLEVGAGIGATTRALCSGREQRWVCLEPDAALAVRAERSGLPACCEVVVGSLATAVAHERFDSVLYVDVLEHIADDRGELAAAARRLVPGGALIVLAPAHEGLYSAFDEAVGHLRRYDRSSLLAAGPDGTVLALCRYLDAAGLLVSAGNRFMLRRSVPTRAQILSWDRLIVPVSRLLDPCFRWRLGRSLLAVWRRTAEGAAGADAHAAGAWDGRAR
jgi:SAM-dependent methyltransferase